MLMLRGHGHLVQRPANPVVALRTYSELYVKYGSSPALCFFIAASLLHVGVTRRIDQNRVLALAGAFLRKYREAMADRGNAALGYYNVGRAFQFIGNHHLAAHAYRQGLRLARAGAPTDGGEEGARVIHAAAYNLSTLYRSLGNVRMANIVTAEFLRF